MLCRGLRSPGRILPASAMPGAWGACLERVCFAGRVERVSSNASEPKVPSGGAFKGRGGLYVSRVCVFCLLTPFSLLYESWVLLVFGG